jgi:hypothetical protein
MVVCFNHFKAQTLRLNNCEGYNMNQFGPPANVGSLGIGSTGINGGTPLAFSYTSTLTNPAATAKSGTRVLQINTNTASNNNSQVFFSSGMDFQRNCANSPMTVSFWMYRTGTDANADRIRVFVNTWQSLTGATFLMAINRSRALAPTVYGMDGWYRYEATIPPAFNSWGNLMFEVIDASVGPTGNIFIDDIQYYDNNNMGPGNVTGGVADAGPDITICNGGKKAIGCTATPFTTYSWAPALGLSSTTVSNPDASPAATTNYTVTTTTSGAGCTTTNTDVVTVTVLAAAAPVMSSATSTNICSGASLAFPFAATNAPTGYIWMASDNANTTGESFVNTINSGTLNDAITLVSSSQVVTYSVSAYNVNCPAGTNPIQSFSVNVNSAPSGSAPLNVTLCAGGTAVFSTVASGGGPYTYQWQQNGVNIGGATLATYSLPGVTAGMNGNTYRCIISNGCAPSATTTAAVLTVVSLSSFTSGATTICSGAAVNVTISGAGGTPPYGFNWIATSNTNVTGESLTTQTGNTINNSLVNTSASTQSVVYTYSVTDANSCIISNTRTITVTNTVITIAAPANITVCQTNVANFTTTAVGGSGSFTFQWQEDNGGGFNNITNGGVYSGATTSILTITAPPTSMNTYRYRCIINDGCTSGLSGIGILNVTPAFSYVSNTADQPIVSNVGQCASKQEILRLRIDMTIGSCPSAPTMTNIVFTAAGTEAEVSKAYIYYTGSNPNFVPTNLFSTISSVVGGPISAAGSQVLTTGSNYFWLVYDINPTGPGVSAVDGTWTNFTFSGGSNPGTYLVSSGNPAGSRSISTCISPGGVSSGLTYWLKSNDGSNLNSSTHDAPINTWSSSFSNVSDLTQPTSTKRPVFKDFPYDTTFNFNPYLAFDGNDDILQNTLIVDLLNDDGLAMVICARSTSVAPNNRTAFGFQSADDGSIAYQIMPESELLYRNSSLNSASFDVTGFTDPDTDFIMAKMVSIVGNSSGSPDIADFRRNDDFFQSSSSNPPDLETGFTIGGSGDGASYNRSNSKIAEVITYNEYLSKPDLDKVETYAAIKYGIHLNKDYVSSAGSTIWDYAADATYNHDIAGIGRDDKSGLNQKQTQSVNIDEMLTIGLDSIENSNKNNPAVFANDDSFLVWGNNNEYARSDYSTIIPAAAPFLPAGIQGRLKRVWKLQGTNFGTSGTFSKSGDPTNNEQNGTMAATTIEVAFDDYLLMGTNPVSNLRLLIDDDGVDFSNAIIKGPGKSSTGATTSGSRIGFTDVTIGPNQNYITLATTNIGATLLPIQLINFNAVCENNMANVSWSTSSETNVREFVIEQSTDGINYSTAKIISPKGNNTSGANYNVICNSIPSKINYFRLKETSNNDIIYRYDPVSISSNCSDAEKTQAFVSPNPISSNKGELTVRFSNEIKSHSDLKIVNSLGNTIYETEYKSNNTYNSLKLQVKNLEIGIYFIEIKNNEGSYRFKVIVVE